MRTGHTMAISAASIALASTAAAEGRTRELEYRQGDTVHQRLIAWNEAVTAKRRGVLVVHADPRFA